jgi:hypothetical protein
MYPSYLSPRQDRWRALHAGCSKIKIQNIFAARNALVEKKPEEVHTYGELFYSLPGITVGREVRLLDAGERPILTPPYKVVGSEFLFLGIVFLEFSVHSGRSILQFVS